MNHLYPKHSEPMASKKKFYVNPYLFYLAKRLVEYDFVKMASPPTDNQLTQFIYDRYNTDKQFANTKWNDPPNISYSPARGIARSFKQYILEPKNFLFTARTLSVLVSEIKTLGVFSTWKEFEETFSKDDFFQSVDKKLKAAIQANRNSPDDELPLLVEDLSLIRQQVNQRVSELHLIYILLDKPNPHIGVTYNSEYAIRSANEKEIKEIIKLASKDENHIKVFDCLLLWHKQYEDIFFVIRNKYNTLLSAFSFVPISSKIYDLFEDIILSPSEIAEQYVASLDRTNPNYLIQNYPAKANFYFEFYFFQNFEQQLKINYEDELIVALHKIIARYDFRFFPFASAHLFSMTRSPATILMLEKFGFRRTVYNVYDLITTKNLQPKENIIYEFEWIEDDSLPSYML